MTNTVKIEMTQDQANYLHALLYGHVCGSGDVREAFDQISGALEKVTHCAAFDIHWEDKTVIDVTRLRLAPFYQFATEVQTRDVTRITSTGLDSDVPF